MGDIFYLDKEEFGETYHVAGALIISLIRKERIKDFPLPKINLGLASTGQKAFIEAIASNQTLLKNGLVAPVTSNEPQRDVSREKRSFSEATEIIESAFRELVQKDKEETEIIKHRVPQLATCIKKYFVAGVNEKDFIPLFSDYGIQKEGEKILVYVRQVSLERGSKDVSRNMHVGCLCQLVEYLLLHNESASIIIAGDINQATFNKHYQKLSNEKDQSRIIVIGKFFEDENFLNVAGQSVSKQLAFYHQLYEVYNLKCVIGMMSGALDGLAFSGIPVLFITKDELNTNHPSRMIKASMDIPYLKPVHCNTDQYEGRVGTECEFEKSVLETINTHVDVIIEENKLQTSSRSTTYKPTLKSK